MLYPSPTQRLGMEAKATSDAQDQSKSGLPSRTLWGDAWKRLRKNKLAIIAAIWIIFVALVAITADLWAPQILGSPTSADTTAMATSSLQPPSLEHPFGTDVTGRDSRVTSSDSYRWRCADVIAEIWCVSHTYGATVTCSNMFCLVFPLLLGRPRRRRLLRAQRPTR